MHKKHWKRAIVATLTSLATAAAGTPVLLAQTADSANSLPAGLSNLSSADSGPVQYLKFAHFNIPFEVDASGPLPREVHLWVSPDQGRSWLKYASTTPDKRSFEFHAAAEGEYLFAVQTRDSQGDSALVAAPPMRILIDTTQPELQLAVDVSPAGRLVIDYQISDDRLAEDSVRLAFSADGQGQWKEIPLDRLQGTAGSWNGRCEIDMPHCRELDVRITANDRAQNQAERVVHFNAPRTAAANTGMQLASQRGDQRASDSSAWVAAAPKPPLHSAQRPLTAGTQQQQQQPRGSSIQAAATAAAQPPQGSAGLLGSQGGIAWNPDQSTRRSASSAWSANPPQATARTIAVQPGTNFPAQPGSGTRLAAAPTSGFEELPRPAAMEESAADAGRDGGELQLGNSSSASGTADSGPMGKQYPVARREVSGIDLGVGSSSSTAAPSLDIDALSIERPLDNAAASPGGTSLSAQPAAESAFSGSGISVGSPASIDDAYHSRSRTFSLDYAVDSLRGAAVSDIELWGTEDRGRTWQKWGSDPDRQSPFDVQVGNDGLFGFRMVVIGANGLISNRPQEGDSADMWINVDTQMPVVSITRALYGEGEQAGMLVIEFNGSDDNMHESPVSLSYSQRPDGPWVTITSGLAATGQYVWKPGSSLPRQVFLRAQAVDRAGNTHEHRLELPVSLRGLAPQGRIQGFRPIDPK